jgi:drug/metabolite transporter (DMT)-like permease
MSTEEQTKDQIPGSNEGANTSPTPAQANTSHCGSRKAVLLMLAAGFFLSSMAATVKLLSDDVPVPQIIFFRNITGAVVILGILKKQGISPLGVNKKLLFLRGAFGTIGLFFFFSAIQGLTLSDAVVLNKTSPFFVILFSAAFLGEKMRKLQIPALGLAIFGIVLISQPRLDYSFLPAAAGLLSAVFAGAAYTTLRHLRHTDQPLVIVLALTVVASVAMLPFFALGYWKTPSPTEFLILCSLGLFALIGQFLMTTAYRHAQAGEVSIYGYSTVLFALVFGLVFWKEYPGALSLLGAAAIVIGAYINAHSGLKAGVGVSGKECEPLFQRRKLGR